jgi:hypothetical protein
VGFVFIFVVGSLLLLGWLFEATFAPLLVMNGRQLFAAFDLVFELIAEKGGIFLGVRGLADLTILVVGLLALHLRRLKDRTGERVDL